MKTYKTLLILFTSLSLSPIALAKCYPGLDCPEDLPNANSTTTPAKPQPEPVEQQQTQQTQQPEPYLNVEPTPETAPDSGSKYKKYKPKPKSKAQQTKTADSAWHYDTVVIHDGCFLMGSSTNEVERGNDEAQHEVCLKSFEIGKYEVTQAQWQSIMGNNPASTKNELLPVDNVNYQDVQHFITKLNQQTGENYRLPTEAEWEYAARAGSSTVFYTGDCINGDNANYDSSTMYNNCPVQQGGSRSKMIAVGSYAPNAWGLYDMMGNVYEWTCSEYDERYTGKEQQCSNSTDPSTHLAIRGGAWNSKANALRSAFRDYEPSNLSETLGFRLVK